MFRTRNSVKNLFNNQLFNLSKFQIFKRKKQTLSKMVEAELKVNQNLISSNKEYLLENFKNKNKHINISLNNYSTFIDFSYTKDDFKVLIRYNGKEKIPILERLYISYFLEDDKELPEKLCIFKIFISKKENNEGIMINACCSDSKIYLLFIMHSEDIYLNYEKYMKREIKNNFRSPSPYKLQSFLRKDFMGLLEYLDINSEFASFLEKYSEEREKILYVEWLKNLKQKCESFDRKI